MGDWLVISIRRILVQCFSNFQSGKQLLIMKIRIWWEKQKPPKAFSSRWIFHKFGAQDWVFKSHSRVLLDFLQILTVLVLLRTILCWSVAIRFFSTFSLKVIYVRFIHLGYTVLKRMPNIKITTSERTPSSVLTIQDWKYDMQKMF